MSNSTAPGGASFADTVPFFAFFGTLSLLATLAITVAFWASPRIRKEHSSILIQLITTCDLLYTLKYTLGAVAYGLGGDDLNRSFNFIPDHCLTAAFWGQLTGMASISWNAMWVVDFISVLRAPVKSRSSQRKWYHIYVWSMVSALAIYCFVDYRPPRDESCWNREHTTFFAVVLYTYLSIAGLSLVYAVFLLRGGGPMRVVRWKLLKQHSVFVAAFIILWAWPMVHLNIDPNGTVHDMNVVDSIVASGQAAVFSFVRLSDERTRTVAFRVWARILRWLGAKLCPCCVRTGSVPKEGVTIKMLIGVDDSIPSDDVDDLPNALTMLDDFNDRAAPLLDRNVEETGLYMPPRRKKKSILERISAVFYPPALGTESSSSSLTSDVQSNMATHPLLLSSFSTQPCGDVKVEGEGSAPPPPPIKSVPMPPPPAARSNSSASIDGKKRPSLVSSPSTTPKSPPGRFISPRQFKKEMPVEVSESWDTTTALRTEIAACILSALCQSVVQADAKRMRFGGRSSTFSESSISITGSHDRQSTFTSTDGFELPTVDEAAAAEDSASVFSENTGGDTPESEAVFRSGSHKGKKKARLRSSGTVLRQMGLVEGDALVAQVAESGCVTTSSPDPTACLQSLCGSSRASSDSNADETPVPARAGVSMGTYECASYEEGLFALLRGCARVEASSVVTALNPSRLRNKTLTAQFTEGASSSFFCKSADGDLLVKTIELDEVNTLLSFVQDYVCHLRQHPNSLLCRIYACASIKFSTFPRIYCLLIGSAFPLPRPERALRGWVQTGRTQVFDLKGSTINRSAGTRKGAGPLLDNDFRKLYPAGIWVQPHELSNGEDTPPVSCHPIDVVKQLDADASFLMSKGIMDYSLLLNVIPLTPEVSEVAAHTAVDAMYRFESNIEPRGSDAGVTAVNVRHSAFSLCLAQIPLHHSSIDATAEPASPVAPQFCLLQLGIIDVLQVYDLKKQAENRFKRLSNSLSIQGAATPANSSEGGISAVDPAMYYTRFSDFMRRVIGGTGAELVKSPSMVNFSALQ